MLVQARLAKRLRSLGLANYGAYFDYVSQPANGDERGELVNCITTNKTDFFRENHHFEFLAKQVIRQARATACHWRPAAPAAMERGLLDGRGAVLDGHHHSGNAGFDRRLGHQDPGIGHRYQRAGQGRGGHLRERASGRHPRGRRAQIFPAPGWRRAVRGERESERAHSFPEDQFCRCRLAGAHALRRHLLPQRDYLFRSRPPNSACSSAWPRTWNRPAT